MKDRAILLVVLFLVIAIVAGCNHRNISGSTGNKLSVDLIVIAHLADSSEFPPEITESNSVAIIDASMINDIVSPYQAMDHTETSRPMEFPRFYVQLHYDGQVVADFSIAHSQADDDNLVIISGSGLGRGNKVLDNDLLINTIESYAMTLTSRRALSS